MTTANLTPLKDFIGNLGQLTESPNDIPKTRKRRVVTKRYKKKNRECLGCGIKFRGTNGAKFHSRQCRYNYLKNDKNQSPVVSVTTKKAKVKANPKNKTSIPSNIPIPAKKAIKRQTQMLVLTAVVTFEDFERIKTALTLVCPKVKLNSQNI